MGTAAAGLRPTLRKRLRALAAELLEQNKGDPTAIGIIRGAAELDPTSPWPHLLLGFFAMKTGNWTDVRESIVQAARVDPDTTFLIFSGIFISPESGGRSPM